MNKFKTIGRAVSVALAAWASIAATPSVAKTVEIVALGDSLTAGLGLGPAESFPEQLEAALRERGHDVAVTNAGVSGDTSADGLARLEWSVPAEADIVIVELGANDALRGIDPAMTRSALSEIVEKLTARHQKVLLAGMLAPPNLGPEYGRAFNTIYPAIAAEHDVVLYPFFLAGVAADASLNQADGMHPTAEGVARIVEGILPDVEALLKETAGG